MLLDAAADFVEEFDGDVYSIKYDLSADKQ